MGLYIVKKTFNKKPIKRFGNSPILFEIPFKEGIDINNQEDLVLSEMILTGERAKNNIKMTFLKRHLSSSLLSDVCRNNGIHSVFPQEIKPICFEPILGQAKTLFLDVLTPNDKWSDIYNALDSYNFIRQGDIIVVDTTVKNVAYFGELNANIALRSGSSGAIINGYTRDSLNLKKLNFPVYARGTYCSDIKYEGIFKSMNTPIIIGEVEINNGDYIFADEDGIISIPQNKWKHILQESLITLEKESKIKSLIINGDSVTNIINKMGTF
jgi:regulator of RNase E activity RraA